MRDHTHYCHHCNGNWSHQPDCGEKPAEQFADEVTDMACPVHDNLPYNENGFVRGQSR